MVCAATVPICTCPFLDIAFPTVLLRRSARLAANNPLVPGMRATANAGILRAVISTNACPQTGYGAGVKGILMAVNEELLKQVLEQIRPNLQADGGDMAYVGVDDEGVVSLELLGHCAGCPMSQLTLSMGIERILKEHVPGVTRVVAVNDLGGGDMADLFDEYTPF